MPQRAPTYHIGPKFHAKLDRLVAGLLSLDNDTFAEEFAGIDEFVARAVADQSDRDDHDLRRTARGYYILEAISYKAYDELNRAAFNRSGDTLIIVPDCLTLHNPDCKKTDGRHGDKCRFCTPTCQAFQVAILAKKYGAKVLFSKRGLEKQMAWHAKRSDRLGIIGIGCLLMLARGMRKAIDLGLPVRGVPLEYCGCEHWNDQPFASAFPLDKLKAILDEKYALRNSPAVAG